MSQATRSLDWHDLGWTGWIPLHDLGSKRDQVMRGAGVYRIRVQGTGRLAYIGQSGRVRERVLYDLAPSVLGDSMPWNDPHTVAPALWAYRVEDGFGFDVSVAPGPEDKQQRNGLEDCLLWCYRVETGTSTLCNYGRFHPRFSRPSNKQEGTAMQRLPEGEANPDSGPSTDPLPHHGEPFEPDWMTLDWTEPAALDASSASGLPGAPGVYKILGASRERVLYIGETTDLRRRIRRHARRDWGETSPLISTCALSGDHPAYQRRELETDLLGGYYYLAGEPPACQYGNLP